MKATIWGNYGITEKEIIMVSRPYVGYPKRRHNCDTPSDRGRSRGPVKEVPVQRDPKREPTSGFLGTGLLNTYYPII